MQARRVLIVLLCIFGVAASVDVLAAVIPTDKSVVPWWGAPQSSSSGPSAPAGEHVHLASCDLLLSVKSSQLTAEYTITTASTSALAKKLDAADTGTENSQVSGLIGYIVIAEFTRGFTGQNHSWKHLDFGQPQLNVTGKKTEIKITSYPIQLQLSTQLISVFQKPAEMHADADKISLDVKGLQLNNDTGMTLDSMSSNQATATATGSTVSFTITEGSPQSEWLMLLRAKGGIFIPIFNNLLSGLGTYLIYSLLLLGLVSAARTFPDKKVIVTSRDVLFTVVAAFITGYVLELLTEIDTRIHLSYIRPQTGAIALLLGGILLIWPKACLAAGREARTGSAGHHAGPGRKCYLLIALALLAEPLVYWIAVHAGWHVNPFGHPAGLAASVVVTFLTLVLTAEILQGARKVTIGLISVAGLAILLTASIVAPILTSRIFTGDHFHEPHVNLSAKLIYLMAALLLVGGLVIMSYRIVQSLGYGLLRSRLTWAAVSIIIAVSIIPNVVENSQITAAHAEGPSVSAFFGLIYSLPQLLDWLLLALAVAAVMALPPESMDSWPCARRVAIPVSLMLLYANVTWLYIPVTLIAGTIAVAALVLPRSLTTVKSGKMELRQALDGAIDARRRAGLAADQSERLNAQAATVPEHPHNPKSLSYEESFESLAARQGFLAKEKAEQKARAQDFRTKAFGGQGWPPDRTAAKKAALLGIFLGIIPAAISIITRQNVPSDSPYFFLHFFGGAAWGILIWPLLGWFIGYFRPIIRGSRGTAKALWIILAYLIGALPMDIIWNSPNAWLNFLVNLSVFGSFTLLSCVVICEIMPLRAAERIADWPKVNNWHFIIGWSTALLAALGTAGVTFLSTAATDLSHQTVTVVTGSSTGYNPGSAP